jgi:hypothetical protein
MASRPWGNRLSLRNQYDTKNPARESFYGRPQSDGRHRQGWLQPYPDPVGAVPVSPEHPRVMKNAQGSFEISVENFAQNGCKNPSELSNHRSTCAASTPRKFKQK